MIDLIKIFFKDKDKFEKKIINNKSSSLNSNYYYKEDDYFYPLKSNIENMKIIVTEKNAYIENSIHTYYNSIKNNGTHNYNDFNYCDFIYAYKKLEQELGYSFDDTYLTRFEFGLNIHIETNPTDFLEDNLLMYKYNTPCEDPKYKINKKFKKFSLTGYEIKVYNKSIQNGLNGKLKHILRVEVKYKSKRLIQKLGVFKLKDIKNKSILKNIFNDYIKKIENLIIIDNYKGCVNMTPKERGFFTKCIIPNYWIDLRKNFSKNMRPLQKNRFLKLVEKYNLDRKKKIVLQKLRDKFEELSFCDCELLKSSLIA